MTGDRYTDEQIEAMVADAERDGMIEYSTIPAGSWVEARVNAQGVTTWVVHVAGDDLGSAVGRAKEALRKATARPGRPARVLRPGIE